MAALTAAILALSAANTVSGFVGQRRGAKIAEQQGNAEGALYDINAGLAEQDAANAVTRGNEAAGRIQRGGKLLAGEQRAAFAAQGIDIGSGSASDVISSDRSISELDAMTVKNNAALEAWGYRTQAVGLRAQGEYARLAGRNEAAALRRRATSTLLSGAGDLASIWQTAPKGVSRAPTRDYGMTANWGTGGL